MPVRVLIALLLLCSTAQAADPWVPFRKAFPGKPPPVVAEPLPPVVPFLPPAQEKAPEAIEKALLEAELQAAIKRAEEATERAEKAEKAAAEALPDPKSPVMLPKPRPKQRTAAKPLNITPACPGPPLAQSCETVCWYAIRYTEAELRAKREQGIAIGLIENRPTSCQEERDGKACIAKFCRTTAKK